eukprot:scaffold421529_cov71-Attheya_sp.AAC.2
MMKEAIIHSTTAYPANHHTHNTFTKAACASRDQQTNREDAISPATIFQMTEPHPTTEYARPSREELLVVHHPVDKIFAHELAKINPLPTLLLTMMKAETIQESTTVSPAAHYYQDMTEQAPRSSQHKGPQHRKQRPKMKHPSAPKKRKEEKTKKKKIKSSQVDHPQNTKTASKFSLPCEIAMKTQPLAGLLCPSVRVGVNFDS